jgi:endogenous inhibitor of DNA gyrase (YacG/DUF329 family)
MPACPNCRRPAAPSGDNAWFPFCSERCKAIDLSRWFGGTYRVPGEELSPDELPAAGPEGDDDEPAPAPRPARKRRPV